LAFRFISFTVHCRNFPILLTVRQLGNTLLFRLFLHIDFITRTEPSFSRRTRSYDERKVAAH